MTYKELYESATRKLEKNEINLGEYEEMIKPLNEDVRTWIPVKWHEISDEEREREDYPKDWVVFLDSVMPSDGEEILITTKCGLVEKDTAYCDDGNYLDSGWDWIDGVVAWMPLPEPYKAESEDKE